MKIGAVKSTFFLTRVNKLLPLFSAFTHRFRWNSAQETYTWCSSVFVSSVKIAARNAC